MRAAPRDPLSSVGMKTSQARSPFWSRGPLGWQFSVRRQATHGFPSALAALAACEAQESQVTVPATHSSMRVAS